MLKIIKGDLFDTQAKYLCHQCNCVTSKAAHLAYDVFRKYPYADVYSPRKENALKQAIIDPDGSYGDTPGDIIIRGNGTDQRYVIAILGQVYPGKPRYPESKKDGCRARRQYFLQGLWKIAQIKDVQSIAFPFGIGCGAAGGDWNAYLKIIQQFSEYMNYQERKTEVLIYKKD